MFLLSCRRLSLALLASALVSLLHIDDADATFTVAAVDTQTKQVGGAGATCIEEDGTSLFQKVYYSVPGKAAFHAQGLLHEPDSPVLELANELILNDTEAAVVLETISSESIDDGLFQGPTGTYPANELRQYGLVNFDVESGGALAGYTGASLDPLYEEFGLPPSEQTSTQVYEGRFGFSAQGNVVANGTVAALFEGFLDPDDNCQDNVIDLAQRLYNSVVKAYNAGLGDVRCDNGVGSTAFLHIDDADGSPVISIDIKYDASVDNFDPFVPLKEEFQAWRQANPCNTNSTTTSTSGGGSVNFKRSFGVGTAIVISAVPFLLDIMV